MRGDDSGLHRAVVTTEIFDAIDHLIAEDSLGAVVTIIAGDGAGSRAVLASNGSVLAGALPAHLDADLKSDAIELMARERSVSVGYGDSELFIEIVAPRPRLFVFGAVHIAQELVEHAALLGFSTVVSDPRAAFLTRDRFPGADELRVGWPDAVIDDQSLDQRTFVVVLTHDRRFEDPLWPLVLPTPVRYIGAMGSAKTTAARRQRLISQGFAEKDVDRIHGPIGLDIGARMAGETAIAILGEMIKARYLHDEEPRLVGKPLRV
jgi:xanthine dehydrogenase accessory factor